MIDFHSHILPNVDDGSANLAESLHMLSMAADDGISAMICTPHLLKAADFYNDSLYVSRFNELKAAAAAEDIQVDLYLGSEIYLQPDIRFDSIVATLNNTGRYFLVEFPMSNIPRFSAQLFQRLIADGHIPIIAHPERNLGFQQRPELAFQFAELGILMQTNAASLTGRLGPKIQQLSHTFIEHNLIQFIGSDCHETKHRVCQLSEAYELVKSRWGQITAENLFGNNAKIVLEGNDLFANFPIPLAGNSSPQKNRIARFLTNLWK